MTQRLEQFKQVQTEALALFANKNMEYGDAFASHGPVGVLVRLGDKLRRYQTITQSGVHLVDDQNVRVTLMDIHNYAIMCIMLLDGNAPPGIVPDNMFGGC